jgi:cytochrome b6-f complex iron-sulfur subunit
MSGDQLLLVGIAVLALAAAVGAFAIAARRSGVDWRKSLSDETIAADRSSGVELPPVPVATEEPAPEAAVLPVDTEPEAVEPEAVEEPVAVAVQVETEQRLVEVSPEEAGVTRRQFFNRALGVTFGTFSGLLGTSFLAFLWPRISGGFGSDVTAGQVGDLLDQAINDDGSITPVFVPEARAYVVPGPDALSDQFDGRSVEAGGVMAIWQKCVHLGCRVPWCSTSQGFECPCHGSKYNSIGEYNAGPAPRNLDRFAVEITDGGELIIKTGTVVETPRAFQPSVSYPQGPSCIGG